MDRGFAVLTVAVAVLSLLSFGFALVALVLRFHNDVSARKTAELTAVWEPTMLEVLAGSTPPQALADLVDERDTPEFLGFLLGYAKRLRGEEREKVRALAAPYLPELDRRVRRRSAEDRGLAVQALAEMGMPAYAGTVAKALDDASPVVAMIAARGLFRPGQERYFSNVLRRLQRFTLWSRSYLASLLAGGGPATAPLLRGMLADPGQPALVRAVATDALASLNDLGSVEVALDLLDPDADRELLAGCLRLVRELGHRGHVDHVMRFVTASDPVIRAAAVAAVGSLGGKADVPILQSLLDDDSYWVSLQAARGLMALGEIDLLRRLAAGDGPWALLAQQVLTE